MTNKQGDIPLLLDVFLRKIVQDTYAHFLPVRCGIELDAGAVEFWANPLLRI